MRSAVEIAVRGQVARGAEQHRDVAVVTAAVHAAGLARAVRDLVFFLHRQRVHVGAQADGARAVRVPAADDADQAGAADAAMHFVDAVAVELPRDQLAGEVFFEAQFGVGVQGMADSGEFAVPAAQRGQRWMAPQIVRGIGTGLDGRAGLGDGMGRGISRSSRKAIGSVHDGCAVALRSIRSLGSTAKYSKSTNRLMMTR